MLGGHGATSRVNREVNVSYCGDEFARRDRAEGRAPRAVSAARGMLGTATGDALTRNAELGTVVCLRTRNTEGPC